MYWSLVHNELPHRRIVCFIQVPKRSISLTVLSLTVLPVRVTYAY